jgi:ABC-type sulfate transport system, periplasmic component
VNLLVDAGLVDANWSHQSYNGIAADTVVVFAVRDGNPKHIKGWQDLIKPGVQVVTPNPFSSGSAKWNILAPTPRSGTSARPTSRRPRT